MIPEFLLYSRPGCHLCEQMQKALQGLDCSNEFRLTVVNIENDPALQDTYGTRIPVLVRADNGESLCQYHLDETALRNCLAGK